MKSDKKIYIFTTTFVISFLTLISANAKVLGTVKKSQLQEVSNSQIEAQIEKSLLQNRDSSYEKKKNSLAIDADKSHKIVDKKKSADKPIVEILVSETKNQKHIDTRTKEKMAYNATLMNQYEAAIELYKQVIEAEPDNYYASFSLATLYQKLGQFSSAKSIYYQLLKDNPDQKDEIINNILTLMIEESPQDSAYVLSRLASENPSTDYILAKAAFAYNKIRKYDRAISYMKQAIDVKPENINYKYNLAIMLDESEQYQKAIDAYYEVLNNYEDSSNLNADISLDQIKERITFIRQKI